MALPLKPDPEWVKTLGGGDDVVICVDGQRLHASYIMWRTPAGRLRVRPEPGQRHGDLYNSNGYACDWMQGSRYLVAPETP